MVTDKTVVFPLQEISILVNFITIYILFVTILLFIINIIHNSDKIKKNISQYSIKKLHINNY